MGNKHDHQIAVDEIIFERHRTVVICVDGEPYAMATETYDGSPITQDIFIEMYPSTTSIENKAYCN
jgi:hypothetical protein